MMIGVWCCLRSLALVLPVLCHELVAHESVKKGHDKVEYHAEDAPLPDDLDHGFLFRVQILLLLEQGLFLFIDGFCDARCSS